MHANRIGLKRGTVQIVSYNSDWPELFEQEKQRLKKVLGSHVHGIQHIGSTSVPGLAAKPIIDMIAAVDDLSVYKELVGPLQRLGYEFMPERVFADRVFFPKGPRENRTYHLSLVVKDGTGWQKPIYFRDYLRVNPDARVAYQELKQQLAKEYANDRMAYTKAKAAMIEAIAAQKGMTPEASGR